MSVELRKLQLTPEERDFYESLYKQSILKFDTFAKSGTLLHNYAHIFDLLTRLRQALDHPYLIVYGADYVVPTAVNGGGFAGRGICALCQDDIGDEPRAVANCGHKFHSDCVKEYLQEAPQLPMGGCGCPSCFTPLTVKFEEEDEGNEGPTPMPGDSLVVTPSESRSDTPGVETQSSTPEPGEPTRVSKTVLPTTIVEKVGAGSFQSSSKIEALIQELRRIPPDSKVLIFSQFTRMLDLIEFRLKQSGIGCAKLTGSLNLTQRTNIIVSFNNDPSVRALLISLKAGGEGLNLQAADHVFLVDVWWNPACELQAIQRAHRIGQMKAVKAIRFVTESSVEEKVVALQEMKQLVFDATVGQSEGAQKKLDESDLRFLFQH
jgi:DNA repair protein RAD16